MTITPKPPRPAPISPPPPPPPSPLPLKDHPAKGNGSAQPNRTCVVLNDYNGTFFREYRTFNTVGTFLFVAHFYNRASQIRKNFTFHVTPGKPLFLSSSF